MNMIGVYPNTNEMSREQLIEYVDFIESQYLVKEINLENKIEHLKSIIKNQKEIDN